MKFLTRTARNTSTARNDAQRLADQAYPILERYGLEPSRPEQGKVGHHTAFRIEVTLKQNAGPDFRGVLVIYTRRGKVFWNVTPHQNERQFGPDGDVTINNIINSASDTKGMKIWPSRVKASEMPNIYLAA